MVVVLGTQWGDEGKGKLVDILANQYDIVARAQVMLLEHCCIGYFSNQFKSMQMRDHLQYQRRYCEAFKAAVSAEPAKLTEQISAL